MFWSQLSQRDVEAAASVSLMSVMRLCMWRSLQYQLIVMFLFFQDSCPGLGKQLCVNKKKATDEPGPRCKLQAIALNLC